MARLRAGVPFKTKGGNHTVALIVQKYGGSSLESADRIRAVAERIVATKKQGNDVVVVLSLIHI